MPMTLHSLRWPKGMGQAQLPHSTTTLPLPQESCLLKNLAFLPSTVESSPLFWVPSWTFFCVYSLKKSLTIPLSEDTDSKRDHSL